MKKSALNRALALFLVVSALFTLPAFAANASYTYDGLTITVGESVPSAQPRMIIWNDPVTASQSHSSGFATNGINGGHMELVFENTGNTPFNFTLYITDNSNGVTLAPIYRTVPPHTPLSIDFDDTTAEGKGLNLKITYKLSTDAPGGMYCRVYATQV